MHTDQLNSRTVRDGPIKIYSDKSKEKRFIPRKFEISSCTKYLVEIILETYEIQYICTKYRITVPSIE